ncbi:MAG TPA: DUF2336 domain-containing protein [Pseudolabrys sp.]|nr:DUF2336 domain-containing protein [Pseudolabrys sp.]
MSMPLPILREIDSAISRSTDHRRADMVRQLTDLYLVNADQYSDDEIALVDEVFVRMVATIEESARALLAIRLGPYAKAPPRILGILACDDVIDIASPVLIQGERLDEATLIKCARTKSQEHLLAISRRKSLTEPVTDILVERGDAQVVLSTAKNAGAKFSSGGFTTLVNRSQGDDLLAACLGARPDLPAQLFDRLLETASDVVRNTLQMENLHTLHDIGRAVGTAAEMVRAKAAVAAQDGAQAQADKSEVENLEKFATAGRFEAAISTLARLSGMPAPFIESKLKDDNAEIILIVAKATGLGWPTTKAILALGARETPRSPDDIRQYEMSFARLQQTMAKKILNFHRQRELPAAILH